MSIGKIGEFSVQTDDRKLYVERLEQFFERIPTELQVPALITVMGAVGYELLVNLCAPDKTKNKTFAQITDIMEKHLQPKPSELTERYKFRNRRQKEGETISEYTADLKKMSKTCEFEAWLEESLRDQLVCGITNGNIQQRLFAESKLDFSKAYRLAVSIEAAEKNAAEVVSRGGSLNEIMMTPVTCQLYAVIQSKSTATSKTPAEHGNYRKNMAIMDIQVLMAMIMITITFYNTYSY